MTDPCPDREVALQAMLDGELDPLASAALEEHLRGCKACREALSSAQDLRAMLRSSDLREAAPPHLRARIEALSGARSDRPIPPRPALPWLGGGAIGALAASLAFVLLTPSAQTPAITADLVNDHIRSLQPGHLTDVLTSDRHTVKPWFNGKVDFSPPVVDLAGQGFPLVGGRLDAAAGRTVAVLVFKRRLHTVSLFVAPKGEFRAGQAEFAAGDGHNLLHWSGGSLDFWAVSDIPMAELREFSQKFEQATRSPT